MQDIEIPEPWPLDKLNARLGALAAEDATPPQPPKGFALVLGSGALDPPHHGHLDLLWQAAQRLEAVGYDVLGMWLCPERETSTDSLCLSIAFRLEACRHIVAYDPLIAVGTWLSTQEGLGHGHMDMCRDLREYVCSRLGRDRGALSVFYACGADDAVQCNLCDGVDVAGGLGVVVVKPCFDEAQVQADDPTRLTFVAEATQAIASSEVVRKALLLGRIGAAVPLHAAQFLSRPTKDELDTFASDYAQLGVIAARGRDIYISLSSLLRSFDRQKLHLLEHLAPDALFFFGSKRSWVFPQSEEEQIESHRENPRYLREAYQPIRELILAKEALGQVFFLKPPGFIYNGDLFMEIRLR